MSYARATSSLSNKQFMSRVSRLDVWDQEFRKETWGICQCCKFSIIYRDESEGINGWHKGHIIHAKNHGADLLVNHKPICLTCNQEDQNFPTNYDYMVFIGTMTNDEANANITKLKADIEYILKNPESIVCIGGTKYGKACSSKRKPHSLFCRKCHKSLIHKLNTYIKKSHDISVNTYLTQLKTLLETDEDPDEILSILTIIDDIKQIKFV